jgi:polar amino acid transport system substrate-binding protein
MEIVKNGKQLMMRLPFSGRFLVCLAVFFTIVVSSSSFANESFSFNTADQSPYSTKENDGVYDRIIIEVFQTLGKTVKINRLPSARSLENVNNGLDDGEYARIAGLTATFPNLRIVNEKLLDFAFTAFVRNPELQINDWNGLAGYHIAFINGWKIYETEVKAAASILKVSTEAELFSLLANGRIDIALYERHRGLHYLRSHKMESIYPLEPPLAVKGMHIYLNSRHESMIPAVDQALHSFKQTPDYRHLLDSF